MLPLIFLLSTFFSICANEKSQNSLFERKIWAFWDDPIQRAPEIVRLCYERIKFVSEHSSYNFTLVSMENYQTYITNFDFFVQLTQKAKITTRQARADLMRFFLLEQHGGIWMDLSTIIFEDLKWLQEILTNKTYLTINNFSDSPDIFMFSFGLYQNTFEQQVSNSQGKQVTYNEFPGLEVWFLAAKKQTPAIRKLKQQFIIFYMSTYEEVMLMFERQGIYIRQEDFSMYLGVDMAMAYLMQKQQKLLDLQSLNIFSNRKNAFEELKVWSSHGEYGPLVFATEMISQSYMLSKTIREVTDISGRDVLFFIKLTQGPRSYIEQKLSIQRNVLRQNNFDMENILRRGPSMGFCQSMVWIVEGSYFSSLYINRTRPQGEPSQIISLEARKRWDQYCLLIKQLPQENVEYDFWTYIMRLKKTLKQKFFQKFYDYLFEEGAILQFLNPWMRTDIAQIQYSQLYEQQELSFLDRVGIYFKANRFLIDLFVRIMLVLAFLLLTVLATLKLLVMAAKYVIRSLSSEFNLSLQRLSLTLQSPLVFSVKSQRLWLLLWLLGLGFSWTMYFFIYFGLRVGEHGKILMVFAFSWVTTLKLEESVRSARDRPQSESGPQMNMNLSEMSFESQMLRFLSPFQNFALAFAVMSLTVYRQEHLLYPSIVLGLVGPLLLRVSPVLIAKSEQISLKYMPPLMQLLDRTHIFSRFFASSVVFGYLLVINLVPNLKYLILSADEPYLLASIGSLAAYYVLFLFALSCYEVLRQFVHLALNRNRTQRRSVIQLLRLCALLLSIYWAEQNFQIQRLHSPNQVNRESYNPNIAFDVVTIAFFVFVSLELEFIQISAKLSQEHQSALSMVLPSVCIFLLAVDHIKSGGFDYSFGFRYDIPRYLEYSKLSVLKAAFFVLLMVKLIKERKLHSISQKQYQSLGFEAHSQVELRDEIALKSPPQSEISMNERQNQFNSLSKAL